MRDPRFNFAKKYQVDPDEILNFYFIESLKFKKKRGRFKATWDYTRNIYSIDLSYHSLYAFIKRYKKFMKWIFKDKPVPTYKSGKSHFDLD